MHDLVIANGLVAVDGALTPMDLGITDGLIETIGPGLTGCETIDASGRWVLPGGIDSHCHLDQPAWGYALSADDFTSGSVSAAFGGLTCIIPFGMPGPGMSTLDAFSRAVGRAEGRSVIDYALHGVMSGASPHGVYAQLERLVASGVSSVKVFMTYGELFVGDDLFLDVLDAARALGLLVMVHAENDAGIRFMTDRLLAKGKTALRYTSVARSEIIEREATHRAATLAEMTGARMAILHVSCAQALEEIVRAKARGVDITGETCPQYLFTSAADLDRNLQDASRFVFAPPPRAKSNQPHLWAALRSGDLDLWSSDHSPYFAADKLGEGTGQHFDRAVNGIPGLETQQPLLFTELRAGRFSLERFLALSSGNAARLYGLDHIKGRLAPGLHADIAIWDPDERWTIKADALHTNVDYTPFEGITVTGRPKTVLVRGTPVIREGQFAAQPGHGVYTHAKTSEPRPRQPSLDDAPWDDRG
ncbi:MAG: dihydropyrimidinase [Mesorhizobium amorphae]|nr:MAG: dihydropyrimidinase [Mesorhizobium amorphae]